MSGRVAVIGLDCAQPSLVFGPWLDDLPNLRGLVERGTWGPLRSVDPPITVPAWTCMLSGRDPGQLGIYGFRNRADHGYSALRTADSTAVDVDRVWDVLGAAGKHVVVIGGASDLATRARPWRARLLLSHARYAYARLHPPPGAPR